MEGSRLWIVVDPVQPHVLMEALVCWRLIAAAVFARSTICQGEFIASSKSSSIALFSF